MNDTAAGIKSETISDILATWLEGAGDAQIPQAASDAALNSVIDVIGLCLAARHENYTRAVLAAWDTSGPSTVFGIRGGLDQYSAAAVNGTAAHGEDFDNTFEGCPVHSGAVVVPAVLAVAEAEGIDGRRTLAAITVGIELMCRLGLVARKGIHTAGFHPTGILGTIAATAAVGVLLRLSKREFIDALGVAGSMASGIIEYLADGSWTKRLHPGWSAQAGIRAARMGKAGFRGPGTVFEGEHGLFRSFAPSLNPDFSQLTDDLGMRWVAQDVAFKPFACGTMTQPFIDCAIALKNDGVRPEDIVEIVCETGEGVVHRLWEPLELKQRPPNAYAAKFSTPYCVAVGLVEGAAGLLQFTDEYVSDATISAVSSKVRYEIDPNNEYPLNYTGHVRALLTDGRVVEKRQPTLRGGVRQPMMRDELVTKYRQNALYSGVASDAADDLLGVALQLGSLDSVAELSNAAKGVAAP